MFSLFFSGLQQDIKIALLPPLLCALFRLAFILVYRPKKTPAGEWRRWYHCFRYGFWWGMDFNAYVYIVALVFISLPGAFFSSYHAWGDAVRLVVVTAYALVLYTAFIAKLIFYYHFHDIFNHLVFLGRNADKDNFRDIFFNQNHGMAIIFSYIPYTALCIAAALCLLALPQIPYPPLPEGWLQYAFNTAVFLASIAGYYWFHYGGTFLHRKKPEWDEVPAIVKDDVFMGKAVRDDLPVLAALWKQKVHPALTRSDDEAAALMAPVLPQKMEAGKSPLESFRREAKGAQIEKPSHIFLLFLESHAQSLFDPLYDKLHLMEASKEWRAEPHTVSFPNFLPGGMISQPSLVSLLTGIFDADMELNENQSFWNGTVQTSLPLQLKKLGYRTSFWYGGSLTWSSLDHFVPGVGFDRAFGGTDICPKDAPRTWLGIYDHIFLEEAARRIEADGEDGFEFHFLYTTSHHGPYRMPFAEYGFDIEALMPEMPKALRQDPATWRRLGSAWYADQAALRFLKTMRERYPDSLFIVTGDHSTGVLPLDFDIVPRREPNLREQLLTSFALSHPALGQEMFAGNAIGSHMNVPATLFELIAPQGFSYYALQKSLLEPVGHVVTPYCWMTRERLGSYVNSVEQDLGVSAELLPMAQDVRRFDDEQQAWCELTGWLVRHPEHLVRQGGTGA